MTSELPSNTDSYVIVFLSGLRIAFDVAVICIEFDGDGISFNVLPLYVTLNPSEIRFGRDTEISFFFVTKLPSAKSSDISLSTTFPFSSMYFTSLSKKCTVLVLFLFRYTIVFSVSNSSRRSTCPFAYAVS